MQRALSLASHSDTSIDVEGVSGDVFDGGIQGQESAHAGDLGGLAQSLEGDSGADLLQILFIELSHHIRLDESGADAVDEDSTGREFLGVRHGHGDDTSLGGGIVRLAGVSELSNHRGNVDDAAGSLLGGNLEECLCAVEYTRKVGIDDGLPGIGLHAHDETVTGDSGVVDQDINGSESLNGFVKELLDLFGIGGCGRLKSFRNSG